MCAVHWKAYVKGLTADRKARATGSQPARTETKQTRIAAGRRSVADGMAAIAAGTKTADEVLAEVAAVVPEAVTAKATTKRERRRTPMANKPEPARVRKPRATLDATETLGGTAYTEAIGSDGVQAALETVSGHGTSEPDDGQVLVAGVLYDAETLEEAVETPLDEVIGAGTEEADAA
jgi:hypothetical protein